jgi:ATP-binding protein involved in chromosome partitioning
MIDKTAIQGVLATIQDPLTSQSILAAERVSAMVIKGNNIGFALEVPLGEEAAFQHVKLACEQALNAALPQLDKLTIVLTASHTLQKVRTPPLPGVKWMIGIGSGKGGVGKSTVAVNFAIAAAMQGLKVGLVDADIYGPSVPMLLGNTDKPEIHENKMVPLTAWGIKFISIGNLIDSDKATIWRGPMITKTLTQLVQATEWGTLDLLCIDLPPGTGDIQLSLMKQYRLDGMLMVTTPQQVAVADVRKAIAMCETLQVPVLGLIENMAMIYDTAGNVSYPFGQGGGEALATEAKVPLLGSIPVQKELSACGDRGTPLVAKKPTHLVAQIFQEITKQILGALPTN